MFYLYVNGEYWDVDTPVNKWRYDFYCMNEVMYSIK